MNELTPISGAAIGLPKQTRRGILLGLAVAATAATLPMEIKAAPSLAESPALIALADRLPLALKEYRDAVRDVAQIVAEWSPQWPIPSDDIIRYGAGCKAYRSIDGRGIEVPYGTTSHTRLLDIGTPEVFEAGHARAMREAVRTAALPSKRGYRTHAFWAEREKARIEPARAYWAEVERITEASGISAAKDRSTAKRDALHGLVDAIMATPETTIEGLAIKAQALAAWSQVDMMSKGLNIRAPEWSDQISAAIMRHAAC